MRKKSWIKELMLPAFWVLVFVISTQHNQTTNVGLQITGNTPVSDIRKMSNYTKSQARYLWFYMLPDLTGSKLNKPGI